MIAIPIILVLTGYWFVYAGVKKTSLADAFSCKQRQNQTPSDQSGTISRIPGDLIPSSDDCTVRAGDTKLPLPNGLYMVWRPLQHSWLPGDGKLLGPCGG